MTSRVWSRFWVVVEFQREFNCDDQEELEKTFGSADTQSLMAQHLGAQAVAAGNLATARSAYAQALDRDFTNQAARLGLAVQSGDVVPDGVKGAAHPSDPWDL